MMGLTSGLHWLAWFVKYLTFMLISVIILTVLVCVNTKNGAIINQSDPSVIFVFFLLYAICTIMFSFMISTFFKKGWFLMCRTQFMKLNAVPHKYRKDLFSGRQRKIMRKLFGCENSPNYGTRHWQTGSIGGGFTSISSYFIFSSN